MLADYPPVLGASRPENFYVVIAGRDQRLHEIDRSAAVWRSEAIPPMYIFWLDEKHLEVVIGEEWRDGQERIRPRADADVSVVTTFVTSTRKRDLLRSDSASASGP